MASPALLDIMSAQVEAERNDVLAQARAEADEIRQAAADRAAEKRERTLAELKAELDTAAARSKERAEAAAEMVALTTKDTVTDELLRSVQQELKARAAAPEFADTLSALLAELMPEAPEGGTVLVPPQFEDHCREWLEQNGHGGVNVKPSATVHDGVAVEDANHKFRVTNTLSTRFERLEGSLRKYCIEALFGGGA